MLFNNKIADLSPEKRNTCALILVVLAGAGLRLFHLGTTSMWFDEAYSWHLAHQSAAKIIELAKIDNTPPVYHLLLRFWLNLGAKSDFEVRLIAALFGILSIWMTYKLGKEIFGRTVGLTAAFISAVSFQLVRYAQENRMYSLQCLLALISVYCFILMLKKTSGSLPYLGWLLSNILNFYNHLFTVFLLFGQWIYFLLYLKRNKRLFPAWLAVNLVLLLFCLPWLPVILRQMGVIQTQYWVLPASVKEILKVGFHLLGGTDLGNKYLSAALLNIPLIAAGVCGIWFVIKDRANPLLTVPLVIFITPLAIVYIISLGGQSLFYYRYFVFLLPMLHLIFAAGITRLAKKSLRILLLGALALTSTIFLFCYYSKPQYSELLRMSLKEVAQAMENISSDGDVVIHLSPGNIGMNTFYTATRCTQGRYQQYIWRDQPPPFFFGGSLYKNEYGITNLDRLPAASRIFVIVASPDGKRHDALGLPYFLKPDYELSQTPLSFPDRLWHQLSERGFRLAFRQNFGKLTLAEFSKGELP